MVMPLANTSRTIYVREISMSILFIYGLFVTTYVFLITVIVNGLKKIVQQTICFISHLSIYYNGYQIIASHF